MSERKEIYTDKFTLSIFLAVPNADSYMNGIFPGFFKRYGWQALLLMPFSIILLSVIMPYYFGTTVNNRMLVVRQGGHRYFSNNTMPSAFTYYFYYVQDLNIRQYG